MKDTFLTKDTKQQVHKDVRPITSDCESYEMVSTGSGLVGVTASGPRVADTGKDALGRPYSETEIDGDMHKTYSPSGDSGIATPRNFKAVKP